MTYKQLIESIEIFAKCNGGKEKDCLEMWATNDEHGINLKQTPSAEDLRKLASFGWHLGCDAIFDDEDKEKWENYDSLTDDEIVALFKEYNGVYLYE